MDKDLAALKSKGGMRRVLNAMRFSYQGISYAVRNEAAIREELIVLAVLVPVSAMLPVADVEHLILVLSMMQVIMLEFVNSGLEAAVDRISLEHHVLSGRAKDLGSVAVGIAVLMMGLCWVVIAGPVVVHWLRQGAG